MLCSSILFLFLIVCVCSLFLIQTEEFFSSHSLLLSYSLDYIIWSLHFFPLLFLALGSFLRILNAAPPFLLSLSPPLSTPETSSFHIWSFLLITLFFLRASTLCRKDWTKHPGPTRFFLCAHSSGLPALWLLPAVLHHHLSHVLPKSERAKLARLWILNAPVFRQQFWNAQHLFQRCWEPFSFSK